MPAIATFVELFKELLPEGVPAFDSGTVTIWVVGLAVLTSFLIWVRKAFEDRIKATILWLLGTVPRALFVAAWFAFSVLTVEHQSWVMLATVALIAPLIAVARLRRGLPLPAVAAISLTVMAMAYWYDWSQSQAKRDAKRVYFILSFANGNRVAADTPEVEESWRDCKATLSDIFRQVPSVKIEINPDAPDYKRYLWEELKSGGNFERVLLDSGRPPDVLLTATISVYSSSKSFKSHPELDWLKKRERELVSTGAQWHYNNLIPLEEKPFVSLAIAAWVWRWVESQPKAKIQIQPSDSIVVNKRILELYAKFLSEREVTDTNLLTRVQSAAPTDDEVARLLDEYHEKFKQSTAQDAVAKGEEENRKLLLNVSQLAKKDQ